MALNVYKEIGWHAIKAGQPLLGLVASKMVLLLDASYEEILEILTDLYCEDSDRLDPSMQIRPYAVESQEKAAALEGPDAISRAAEIASSFDIEYPEGLPRIPLFSYLEPKAFVPLLSKVRLRRYAKGETIIEEGKEGDSFYLIADGEVAVTRKGGQQNPLTLAHLGAGSVFGEMALISSEPRNATVSARGDVDMLEIKRSDLVVVSGQVSGLKEALQRFTRERFLGNLTATHPFFKTLNRKQRHSVMDLFESVEFSPGEDLIREEAQAVGLFLILEGSATVSTTQSGERVQLATLKSSSLCGEMSLIQDKPTSATVRAKDNVVALLLIRSEFQSIMKTYPGLEEYLRELTGERILRNLALLYRDGLFEDDEHILI